MVNDNDYFLFHIIGTDRDGKTSEFTAPLLYVEDDIQVEDAIKTYHNDFYTNTHRTRNLGGQSISYAESKSGGSPTADAADNDASGGTSLSTSTLTFYVNKIQQINQPSFYPTNYLDPSALDQSLLPTKYFPPGDQLGPLKDLPAASAVIPAVQALAGNSAAFSD